MAADLAALEPLQQQAITARLAGAGSMRAEIEHVLQAVASGASADGYRRAILDENAARKASASARSWAWLRLKLRYALDRPTSAEFIAFRRAMADPDGAGRGLSAMLMLARRDRLFREVTLGVVAPLLVVSAAQIDIEDVRIDVEGRMQAAGLSWSSQSLAATTNHLLSSWKDFGMIEGSKVRRVAKLRPSHATIRFAVELGRGEGLTDRQNLESTWFRLLGMDAASVEGGLYAAARAGVLDYRSQADVVEIVLPDEQG